MSKTSSWITLSCCILLVAAVLFLSCSGDNSTGTSGTPQNMTITMGDDFFSPANVSVPAGTTVVWRNDGTHDHTVTSGTASARSGLFGSGTMSNGQTFQYKFSNEGTFVYFCTIHGATMTGSVTVTKASGNTGY
jgi:plastocyanin